jgi:hypothetical protein
MELVRFLIPSAIAGSLSGVLASLGLIAMNVGSLRSLVLESADGWLAAALLAAGLAVTLGSAAVGAALFSLRWERE